MIQTSHTWSKASTPIRRGWMLVWLVLFKLDRPHVGELVAAGGLMFFGHEPGTWQPYRLHIFLGMMGCRDPQKPAPGRHWGRLAWVAGSFQGQENLGEHSLLDLGVWEHLRAAGCEGSTGARMSSAGIHDFCTSVEAFSSKAICHSHGGLLSPECLDLPNPGDQHTDRH